MYSQQSPFPIVHTRWSFGKTMYWLKTALSPLYYIAALKAVIAKDSLV